MSEPEPEQQPDEIAVVADGIDEYIDKARYKMLFDARTEAAEELRSVPDTKVKVGGSSLNGPESEEYVRASAWSAVNTYIHEAEPLYRNTDIGQNAWESGKTEATQLPEWLPGRARIEQSSQSNVQNFSWSDVVEYELLGRPSGFEIQGEQPGAINSSGASTATVGRSRRSRSKNGQSSPVVHVHGISAFTDLAGMSVRVKTRTDKTDWRGNAKEDEIHQLKAVPPLSVTRRAYRITNRLLSELGVGLEAETEEEKGAEWSADYRDED